MTPAELVTRQKELGLSNMQLAKALGYSSITISYWRNGVRPIPADLATRLAQVAPANDLPPMSGRPRKATYALPRRDGTYAFYFDQAGNPLSNEDKMAMQPGSIFWLAYSPTSEYDGSVQYKYERSRIPGHRHNSHPFGSEMRSPPK